jgi:hypothetical protein
MVAILNVVILLIFVSSLTLHQPEFFYRAADYPQPKAVPQLSVVVLEFSRLEKACRYEKGGYCKLARERYMVQNCQLPIKPNKIY